MVRLPTASMITQRRDATEANPPRFGTASLIIGRTDRPAGALRIGRSWVVFRGLAGISRAGLIDRGILMRFCGNPVREEEPPFASRSQCWPEVLTQLSFQAVFPRRARYFFDCSKKLLDISASGGVSVHPMLSGKRLPRASSFSG